MPYLRCAWRAAIAALSKKQKPIGLSSLGVMAGRTHRDKGVLVLARITASVAATAPPTPRITASQVPGDIEVSPSI